MEKSQLESHTRSMVMLSQQLDGRLTTKETTFLAVLPFLAGTGEILEIGSYKGKSTIILAKSAMIAGRSKIHACDPLTLPSVTDPKTVDKEDVPEIFTENLKRHGVTESVEFHQMKSSELSRSWNLPLRVLWIDGDHTFRGVTEDFELYHKFLEPGAIVCLHDVLHEFEGPTRVLAELILLSSSFGDCGICGSIGWGQFLGDTTPTKAQWNNKLMLYKKLSRLIPQIVAKSNGMHYSKFLFKVYRELVPHGSIDPYTWLTKRNNWYNERLQSGVR
jgi:predicted O-methyltransferase YrrM